MNFSIKATSQIVKTISLISLFVVSTFVWSNPHANLVDDFNHDANTHNGHPRQFMNDSVAGGQSKTTQMITQGVLHLKGELVPPRGQPGWASTILPLAPIGSASDASNYEGIKVLVKLNEGNLTLSANSNEITNFDFHSAPLIVSADGNFHEVKIPFSAMKRGWSEQIALNTATLGSLSIVAYSLQPASFDFEVDEVSFY